MLKSLRVMAGLDLLIEVFGVNWSYLYLQDGRGDVTMLPDPTLKDYIYLIDNIDNRNDLKRYLVSICSICFSLVKTYSLYMMFV